MKGATLHVTQEKFSAMAVDALRALADAIESGVYTAQSVVYKADSLTVTYEQSHQIERQVQPRADPKRPCEHTSKPVSAGGVEVACTECGAVWTP